MSTSWAGLGLAWASRRAEMPVLCLRSKGPVKRSTSATVPPPPTADAAWQRDVGRYRNAWGDLQVLVVGGRLTLIGPALLDPLPVHGTLAPIGPHTFRLESKDGYSSHGEGSCSRSTAWARSRGSRSARRRRVR